MHILRSDTATVQSSISIGWSIKQEMCLQDIKTDRQMDRVIPKYSPPQNYLQGGGGITSCFAL